MAGSGKGYLRGQDQLDAMLDETSRVGTPAPMKPSAADRRPKVRKDPDAPVQERVPIARDVTAPSAPVEAPPTAGRTSFGVGMGDQDRPSGSTRRRY